MTAVAEEAVDLTALTVLDRLTAKVPAWAGYSTLIRGVVDAVFDRLLNDVRDAPTAARTMTDDQLYDAFVTTMRRYTTFDVEIEPIRTATIGFLKSERDRILRDYQAGETVVFVQRESTSRYQVGEKGEVLGQGSDGRVRVRTEGGEEVRVFPKRMMVIDGSVKIIPYGGEGDDFPATDLPPYVDSAEMHDPVNRIKALWEGDFPDHVNTAVVVAALWDIVRGENERRIHHGILSTAMTNRQVWTYFLERLSYNGDLTLTNGISDANRAHVIGVIRQAQAMAKTEWRHEQPGVSWRSDYVNAGQEVWVSLWTKGATSVRVAYASGSDLGYSRNINVGSVVPLAPPPVKEGSIPWLLDQLTAGNLSQSRLKKRLAEMGDPHQELEIFKQQVRSSLIREAKTRDWCAEADGWIEQLGLPGRPRPRAVRRRVMMEVDVSVNVTAMDDAEAERLADAQIAASNAQTMASTAIRNGNYHVGTAKFVPPATT